jgi:hypothetical protein
VSDSPAGFAIGWRDGGALVLSFSVGLGVAVEGSLNNARGLGAGTCVIFVGTAGNEFILKVISHELFIS